MRWPRADTPNPLVFRYPGDIPSNYHHRSRQRRNRVRCRGGTLPPQVFRHPGGTPSSCRHTPRRRRSRARYRGGTRFPQPSGYRPGRSRSPHRRPPHCRSFLRMDGTPFQLRVARRAGRPLTCRCRSRHCRKLPGQLGRSCPRVFPHPQGNSPSCHRRPLGGHSQVRYRGGKPLLAV